MNYRYEPEEFCGRGYWLDFMLPRWGNYDKAGTFIEIKAAKWQTCTKGEKWKIVKNKDFEHGLYTLLRLAKYTKWNYNYYLIVGNPGIDAYRGFEIIKPNQYLGDIQWCGCHHGGAVLADGCSCCICSDSGGCFVDIDAPQLLRTYKLVQEVLPFERHVDEIALMEELEKYL